MVVGVVVVVVVVVIGPSVVVYLKKIQTLALNLKVCISSMTLMVHQKPVKIYFDFERILECQMLSLL